MSKIGETGSQQPAQYRSVTFNDSQNRKKKNIEIPIGSKISTTSSEYEIKGDGIYIDGRKINEIPVTLPQMTALEVFDANKDNKIDIKDSDLFDGGTNVSGLTFDNEGRSAAREINDKLARYGSKYEVPIIEDEGGTSEDAAVYEGGFFAYFQHGSYSDGDIKTISIETPEYQEYKKAEDERIAAENAERERANSFWGKVQKFFGF